MIAARVSSAKPVAAKNVQAAKPKVAPAVLGVFAAAMVVFAPIANAAETASVRQVLCSSNPTSKVCLKDSAKN
ncbi:hypothetical protein CHLRE_09g402219v5 [Chlamydomonas reinhardtii]|uniref:Uncharacterized protein n=1 Tax=Chlamydomonas reinhardtii TaxID=3055 RepID=A0A2K3DF54_CHLRE|nr:uncharacterized protein CHLRE_09g402219v5 [Chlamydomonas reinhardtii]XP_042921421.1 uncharacterized protein CHLRE_09g402219v5 [Chlamydomonas reinhardtii]PNW79146.1 hypothetical protein CHLRE_09g402219v5 [Chlamydomonas reinhardtii]PNW79147.1 hypothetical protein CHLRE_09g402219v5 [Chlamydomonas reinhardtii]